ncbi:MAG: hypothetical protein QN143_07280 [Armatimonadota bacterium]|nr:hypothetical protein [Armatimonadota bacterium]
MAFTVRDLKDLLALLEQHPEWKSALRASLLGEEVLRLPEVVRELAGEVRALAGEVRALAEAQRRTDERLEELASQVRALAEAQRRTDERLEELASQVRVLAEAQRRTDERLEELAKEVQALAKAQRRTESRVDTLDTRVADLLGRDLERQYRERAFAYFQRILKAIRPVEPVTLQRVLDDAVGAGRITEEEKDDLLLADVLVLGRHQGEEAYLVAEVSGLVGAHDVERAARRAEVLRRATEKPTLAAVAGHHMEDAAEAEARVLGVWRVLDGRTLPPEG